MKKQKQWYNKTKLNTVKIQFNPILQVLYVRLISTFKFFFFSKVTGLRNHHFLQFWVQTS